MVFGHILAVSRHMPLERRALQIGILIEKQLIFHRTQACAARSLVIVPAEEDARFKQLSTGCPAKVLRRSRQ
jgi:hypothetical protein